MQALDRFAQTLAGFVQKIPGLSAVAFNLLFGAVLLFLGYRLFRLWLFVLGAQSGYALARAIVQRFHLDLTPSVLIYILCILALAILYWVSQRYSIAASGFSLGLLLARHYGGLFVRHVNIFVMLGAALVCAVLAYIFSRIFIIVGTVAYGSLLFCDGLYALALNKAAFSFVRSVPNWQTLPALAVVLCLVLFVLGFIYQYRVSGRGTRVALFF